jgi:hypothetical protein
MCFYFSTDTAVGKSDGKILEQSFFGKLGTLTCRVGVASGSASLAEGLPGTLAGRQNAIAPTNGALKREGLVGLSRPKIRKYLADLLSFAPQSCWIINWSLMALIESLKFNGVTVLFASVFPERESGVVDSHASCNGAPRAGAVFSRKCKIVDVKAKLRSSHSTGKFPGELFNLQSHTILSALQLLLALLPAPSYWPFLDDRIGYPAIFFGRSTIESTSS